jgi:predicted secreted protein
MASYAIAGFEGQIYVSGVRVIEMTDATFNVTADKLDASSHTTGGWKASLVGLKEWSLDVKAWFADAAASQQTVRTALINGTQVAVEFRTKDSTGKEKITGNGKVYKWDHGMPQNAAQDIGFHIDGDEAPTFTTVA